jgi:hypothetical protein
MPTLFGHFPGEPVDVLKVDIEGTETQVFKDNSASWLSQVRNVMIELHGKEAEATVLAAVPSQHFARSRSGELTIFQRRSPTIGNQTTSLGAHDGATV